jgi:hypothetical protein
MLSKEQAMATRICNKQSLCFATGKPGGGSQTQGEQQAGRESQFKGGAEGVQESAKAEGRMKRLAKRMPRQKSKRGQSEVKSNISEQN